jgi:hypothetical protein
VLYPLAPVDHVRDLGLLKRDKRLQQRYQRWTENIKAEYGSTGTSGFFSNASLLYFPFSIANYLRKYRLQWGKADTLSKLPSRLFPPEITNMDGDINSGKVPLLDLGLPQIPPGTKPHFTADIPLHLVSIIMNDWPYSGRHAFPCP